MTSKKFTLIWLLISLFFIVSIAALNFSRNEFGLFGNVKGEKIRIYDYERMSKYLLSFSYIPQNFDSVLFGASVSNLEMDMSKIDGMNIYNLSTNGANISELKYLVDNVIEKGNLKTILVCLDPYMTKNSGHKTSSINPRLYYSTLGSLFTLKYYSKKRRALANPSTDPFRDSWNGLRYNKTDVAEKYDSETEINKDIALANSEGYTINVDPIAVKELDEVLTKARNKGIKVFAYYHPKPYKLFSSENYQKEYRKFQNEMSKLLIEDDIVFDMNTDDYRHITESFDSYSDGAHLSAKGAAKVISALNEKISEHKFNQL